jgi:hypothetical protein
MLCGKNYNHRENLAGVGFTGTEGFPNFPNDSLSLAARAKLRQLGVEEQPREEQPQENVWTGDK